MNLLTRTLCVLLATILCNTDADILTFEKSGLPDHATTKHDKNEESHLPLSSLFSQSDRYKCLIEGKKELCTNDDVTYMKEKFGADVTQEQPHATQSSNVKTKAEQEYNDTPDVKNDGVREGKEIFYGPRFQPVHLHLPRKAMYRVSCMLY